MEEEGKGAMRLNGVLTLSLFMDYSSKSLVLPEE
jgi:hypothetical protein